MDTLNHAQAAAILGLSLDCPPTTTIPDAGWRLAELSRNGSYEAAKRGDIEFIQVGRLKRVPIISLAMKILATGGQAEA